MASKKEVWSTALFEFLQAGFKPGEIIPQQWFLDHFNIETPGACSRKEWLKYELNILSYFMPFREKLLKEHFVDLQPCGGSNFTIVPPVEQTSVAMTVLATNYKRIHKRGTNRLRFVNTEGFTQQQLQENADALAKVSQLKAMAQPIWTK
jgi:hypothetical protein